MATAREKLLQALSNITNNSFSQEGETSLKRLLNTFRIQSKTSIHEESFTARDTLLTNLLQTWKTNNTLEKKDLQKLILPFRMQIKQGLNSSRFQDYKKDKNNNNDQQLPNNKNRLTEKINSYENAYFKDKKQNNNTSAKDSSVAGGPVVKNGNRGICPKCRSLGLVLARSYGKEDRYSCIYCGYQSFIGAQDDKLDLCMAAHLLGDFLDE